jgi:hypothetical protein
LTYPLFLQRWNLHAVPAVADDFHVNGSVGERLLMSAACGADDAAETTKAITSSELALWALRGVPLIILPQYG